MGDINQVSFSAFLPNKEDCGGIQTDFITLISHVLVTYVPVNMVNNCKLCRLSSSLIASHLPMDFLFFFLPTSYIFPQIPSDIHNC